MQSDTPPEDSPAGARSDPAAAPADATADPAPPTESADEADEIGSLTPPEPEPTGAAEGLGEVGPAEGERGGGSSEGAPPFPPPGPGGVPGGAGGGGWMPPFQILRSRQDRKLGGVAGGLAVATGLDATLVRLAIVLGFLTGWGVLLYLVAWAVIPEEDPALGRHLMPAPEPTAKQLRIGIAVVGVVGLLQILGTVLGIVSSAILGIGLFPLHVLGFGDDDAFEFGEALLGVILVVGGALVLFRRYLPWSPGSGPRHSDSGSSGWAGPSAPAGVPGAAAGTTGPSGEAAPGYDYSSSGATGAYGGPSSGAPGTYGGPSSGATGTYGGPSSGATGAYGGPSSGAPGAYGGPSSGAAGSFGGGSYGPPPPHGGPAGGPGFGARASAAARAAVTNGPLLLVRATGWLVALWFLAAMLVGLAFWLFGALAVRLPVLPIVTGVAALGVLGSTLIRSRRIGPGIAAMALLLVPATLAVALTRVDGQAGDRSVTPLLASDLERQYRHSVGTFDLDLSALQLPPGSRTRIDLSIGVGRIDVIVPWDADVEARAHVDFGSFNLFGNRQTGVDLSGRTHSRGQPGAAILDIRSDAGAGEVVVRRGFEPVTQQALRAGEPVPMRCGPIRRPLRGPGVGPPVLFEPAGTLHCTAPDGFTGTPPLTCLVSSPYGEALCRPVGEPEAPAAFAGDPGTMRCRVPAGGGESPCAPVVPPPDPAPTATTTTAPSAPAAPQPPSAPPGEYRCTIPEGGGPATCVPA